MSIFLALVTSLLLTMAIAGQIRIPITNAAATFLFWFLAWVSQSFAPQLAIASLLLGYTGFSADHANSMSLYIVIAGVTAVILFLRLYWLGYKTASAIDSVVDKAISKLEVNAPPSGKNATSPTLVGLRPFNFNPGNVTRIKNIAYGDAGEKNYLDIYQPQQKPASTMPILIHIPGGAWITGSKNEQGLPLLHHMAARGWTCFSANYRLGPQARFPAMLEDVLRTIAWVKSHAADYGANPDFIAITGGSAGGHLLSLAALIQNRAQFQPGFEDVDTRVSVAVPFYGRYDFLNRHQLLPDEGLEPFLSEKVMPDTAENCHELWQLASPEAQVHANAPPFLIIHGSADSMIPVEEAHAFARALQAVSSQAVDYVELPKAQHGFEMVCSSWAMPSVYAVSRYLDAQYSAHMQQLNKP